MTDGRVVELDNQYGYESKAVTREEEAFEDISELPIVKIDEWLSPEAEKVVKWIKLPSRNAKVLIRAMTSNEFKKMRKDAPVVRRSMPGGKVKLEKDEDWIQNQLIVEGVVEPKITDPKILDYGLAGDVTFLVMEISKLSGFDVDKAIRDALE
jgi:hypothetical protein